MLCANQSNINKKQTAFPLYTDIQITSSYVPGTGASTQSDLDLGRDWQTQQILYEGTSKVQNNVAHLSLKTPGPDHITHHLCTLHCCQMMLESNSEYLLNVSVLSLLLALSTFLIYIRSTCPLGSFDLPLTATHCVFHLSTLSHMVNAWPWNTLPKNIRSSQ